METKLLNAEVERVDVERKYLEVLLKDRINFYIVFVSLFAGGLNGVQDGRARVVALAAAATVSLLIGFAVLRTHRLLQVALKEIIGYGEQHPYTRYRKAVKFPPNANWFLIAIPFILTAFFIFSLYNLSRH